MNNEKQDGMNVSFTPLHLKARTVSVSDDLRTWIIIDHLHSRVTELVMCSCN